MHRHNQPVAGLLALPFDLPPLIQRGRLALAPGAAVHLLGHRRERAELVNDQEPLRVDPRPALPRAGA